MSQGGRGWSAHRSEEGAIRLHPRNAKCKRIGDPEGLSPRADSSDGGVLSRATDNLRDEGRAEVPGVVAARNDGDCATS